MKKINTDNYPEYLPGYYENRSYTFDFYQEKGIHYLKFYWEPCRKYYDTNNYHFLKFNHQNYFTIDVIVIYC